MTKTKFTNAVIIIGVLMLLVLPACAAQIDVTGITPSSWYNNDTIAITDLHGNNFTSTSGAYLQQGAISEPTTGTVYLISSEQLACSFDLNGLPAGSWNVTVFDTTDVLNNDTLIDSFTVFNPPPALLSIQPQTGVNNGNLPFLISGTGLIESGAVLNLTKSGVNITASGLVVNPNSTISGNFNINGAQNGTWNVVWKNYDGNISNTLVFTITNPLPTITGITPVAPTNDIVSQPVQVSGTGYLADATVAIIQGSTQVSIPGPFTISSTNIGFFANFAGVPVGPYNVTVTNPDLQNVTSYNGIRVFYPAAPVVNNITPSTGFNTSSISGVLIGGSGFQPGATVLLNKTGQADIDATSVVVNNQSSITCNLPITGALAGLWNVKVTNNDTQYSNIDVQFNITMPPAPTASFTAVPLSGPVPLNVQFNDTSAGTPTAWNWSFGDGTFSNSQNTTHSYAAGTWSAQLTVSNAYGSSTSAAQTITASPPPLANFTYASANGFAPCHVFFSDTSVTNITSRLWRFGVDEFTATSQPTDFTYYNPGNYTVNLTVTNASGTSSIEKTVQVTTKPVANFTGSPTSGAKPLLVNFTDLSTDATGWLWNFGDGTNSTLQNPNHTYADVGVYSVSLIPFNAGGSGDIMVKTGYITVLPQNPVASFNANPVSGTTPLLVTFNDTSSNNPTAWMWNFGDGANSTLQNPTHTYTTGSWNVTLTATNSAGGNTSAPVTIFVSAAPVPPVANFTYTSENGFAPRHVYFSDTSVTGITGRLWRFGIDEYTASSPNPDFTYYNPGNYTVNLTVTNSSGTSAVEKTVVVTTKPVANFTGSPISGTKPLQVNFADLSTDATGWYWNFGDGTNSTLQNPNHTYADAGVYTVSLIPSNAGGNGDPLVKTGYITVLPQYPVASFTANLTSGISPLNVAFNDTSSNNPTAWIWNFGDGANSTLPNPTHIFNSGTWNVTLTATNSAGGNTSAPVSILVTPAPVPPVANFTASPTAGFKPLYVQFTDTSATGITNWLWKFGIDQYTAGSQNPDFTYNQVGNYTVNLTVTNASGTTTVSKSNYIVVTNKPVSNFTATPTSGIRPLLVNFTDLSTDATGWYWDFGDGTNSTEANPGHVYTNEGVYSVSLTAKNAGGSGDTVVKINYITARIPGPVANFNANPTHGDIPLTVQFNDTSLYAPTSWNWDFGDFTSSNLQNPSHTYTTPGLKTVRLEVSNSGGTNVSVKPDLINVTQPKPNADFTGYPASGISRETEFHFIDLSTNNPTSWDWNFGDGTHNTSQNATHIYQASGNYYVSLTATNAGGSDTETKGPIVVKNPRAIANFTGTPTLGSLPLTVQFTDTSSNFPNTWAWDFGDNTFARDIRNPVHTYNQAGSYTVTLAVNDTTAGQPASTLTRTAYITATKTPFAEFTATPTSGTAPLVVRFTDHSQGNPIRYYWRFGDGTVSNARNPTHIYQKPGVYTVSETVQNFAGFNTTVKQNLITVTEKPQASFIVNATSGIAPTTIRFTDTSSGVPTAWSWDFGDGSAISTEHNPVHTYYTSGVYSVQLIVSNAIGSSTATKTSLITIGTPTGADFTMKPAEGDVPLMIQFTDNSAGAPILVYKWEFGDGYISRDTNPVHNYMKPGNYTVTLTIITNTGTSTVSKELVLTGTPVASFKAEPTGGSTPLTVQFKDTSSNAPTTWFWTYGDGTFGNVKNPVHTYNSPGTYTVKLFVSNSYGNDLVSYPSLISVSQFP